jgi:rod shape-determining protein MreD
VIGRAVVILLLVVTTAVVQTAVLPLVAVAGFRPDLLLLLTISFAVHDGPEAGVRIGFGAGLATDLLLQTSALGVAALTYAVVGYLVGIARPYLATTSMTAPLLLAFGGSTVGSLVLGLLSSFLGDAVLDLPLVLSVALFVGIVHTLLIPLVLRLTRQVSARFPAEGTAVTR